MDVATSGEEVDMKMKATVYTHVFTEPSHVPKQRGTSISRIGDETVKLGRSISGLRRSADSLISADSEQSSQAFLTDSIQFRVPRVCELPLTTANATVFFRPLGFVWLDKFSMVSYGRRDLRILKVGGPFH